MWRSIYPMPLERYHQNIPPWPCPIDSWPQQRSAYLCDQQFCFWEWLNLSKPLLWGDTWLRHRSVFLMQTGYHFPYGKVWPRPLFLMMLAKGCQNFFIFHQQEFGQVEFITHLPSVSFPTCRGVSAPWLMTLWTSQRIEKTAYFCVLVPHHWGCSK